MSKLKTKMDALSTQIADGQQRAITTKSRSKKYYVAFTVFVLFVYVLALSSKFLSGSDKTEVESVDYDKTISIEGEYDLKVTNAQYNEETKQLRFDLFVKHYYENYSVSTLNDYEEKITKPTISKVLFDAESITEDSALFAIAQDKDQQWHSTVTVKCDNASFENCVILFDYTILEYKDSDTVDVYGNIIEGETHDKEEVKCYVGISRNDIKAVDEWSNLTFAEENTEALAETPTAAITSTAKPKENKK